MINTVDLPIYLRSESSFKDAKRLTRDAEIEETKGRAERKNVLCKKEFDTLEHLIKN